MSFSNIFCFNFYEKYWFLQHMINLFCGYIGIYKKILVDILKQNMDEIKIVQNSWKYLEQL